MTNEAVEMEPSGRVLPIFRGEYDADRTYENPDIVLFRNSSYVAKQVTVGNPPPTDALADDYWQMVAKGIIDADVSDSTIEFTEATKRSNIESGEKSNIIMGKIMKFFTDLKDIAFSGRYSDLSDKPISITEDGNDSIISLEGGEQRSIGLINQLQAVNFKNEGGGPNQGMKFVTRQPSTGDIVFGNLDGDTDLMFPFSFGIDENGDYGYKKFKTNKFTPFGNVYTKNVLNTTEQISANTASGNIAGALAAKAMMADYNAKINQINSNISEQIYDFETSTFLNNITYVTRLSEWYPKNKIYKIGRICWMSLGIKTKNVTENDKVLNVAAIPDAFAPIAVVSKRSSDYTVGIYPGNNLLYASERDVTKFPNWSDVAGEGKEEFIEFNFVYFSKI